MNDPDLGLDVEEDPSEICFFRHVARMEEGSDVQTWGVVRVHGVEGNKKIHSQ